MTSPANPFLIPDFAPVRRVVPAAVKDDGQPAPISQPALTIDEWPALFSKNAPTTDELYAKPSQASEYGEWVSLLQSDLLSTGSSYLNFFMLQKADGHSCILECNADGTCELYHRTPTASLLLSGFNMRPFLNEIAFKLRVKFTAELCALYQGKEMGFLEVLPMLKLFKDNGYKNTGEYQLLIRPFGVYSIEDETNGLRSGSSLGNRDLFCFLEACIVPGNGLVDPVSHREVRARLRENTPKSKNAPKSYYLEFSQVGKENDSCDSKAFFKKCIEEADELKIEGWVFRLPPECTRKIAPKQDPWKQLMRFPGSVKVKKTFQLTLAACKVKNTTKRTEEIWLFGKKGEDLVYVGKTDNQRLASMVAGLPCGFKFANDEECKALHSLNRAVLEQKKGCFKVIEADCTNLSKTHFSVIGLKYNMRALKYTGFYWLSDTEQVAMGNPHFVQTKTSSDAFAKAIGREQGKRKKPTGETAIIKRPVVKAKTREDTPPREVFVAREDTPPRQEEEEPAPKRAKFEAPRVALDLQQLGPIGKSVATKQFLEWKIELHKVFEEAQIVVTSKEGKATPRLAVPHFTLEEFKAQRMMD